MSRPCSLTLPDTAVKPVEVTLVCRCMLDEATAAVLLPTMKVSFAFAVVVENHLEAACSIARSDSGSALVLSRHIVMTAKGLSLSAAAHQEATLW